MSNNRFSRKWTKEEDIQLLKTAKQFDNMNDFYEYMHLENPERTVDAYRNRYYNLKKKQETIQEPQSQYEDFLTYLEQLKMEYTKIKEENLQLKKQLEEMAEMKSEYNTLLEIMERARKIAFTNSETLQFKMAVNGNLEKY